MLADNEFANIWNDNAGFTTKTVRCKYIITVHEFNAKHCLIRWHGMVTSTSFSLMCNVKVEAKNKLAFLTMITLVTVESLLTWLAIFVEMNPEIYQMIRSCESFLQHCHCCSPPTSYVPTANGNRIRWGSGLSQPSFRKKCFYNMPMLVYVCVCSTLYLVHGWQLFGYLRFAATAALNCFGIYYRSFPALIFFPPFLQAGERDGPPKNHPQRTSRIHSELHSWCRCQVNDLQALL